MPTLAEVLKENGAQPLPRWGIGPLVQRYTGYPFGSAAPKDAGQEGLANFLAQHPSLRELGPAVTLAGFLTGKAAPKPAPLTPAVKVSSEGGAPGVYSAGPTHGEALTEWLEARRALKLPEIKDEDWDTLSDHVTDGYTYVGPDGKPVFLNRVQAGAHLGKPGWDVESGELPNASDWD